MKNKEEAKIKVVFSQSKILTDRTFRPYLMTSEYKHWNFRDIKDVINQYLINL